MALYLEILTGDQTGQRYALRAGLTIGRRDSDVILNDSKVSSRHASTVTGPDGGLFMVDAGSSNGLKVDGQKRLELELLPGVGFQIGRTRLRVLELDPAEAGEIVVEAPQSWQQIVAALALKAIDQARPSPRDVTPFHPPFKLRFVQGIQAGTEWVIGYGPRNAGAGTADLVLEDAGLPAQCFHLIPHQNGVLMRSEGAVEIRVNGSVTERAFLKDGDVLELKTTRMLVSFLKMKESLHQDSER